MIFLRLQHPGNQNVRKLAKVFAPIFLAVLLLLLLGFSLMPKAAAVPPARPLLEWHNPVINPISNTHTAPPTTTVSITYDNEDISAATISTRTFAVHAMQTGLLTQTYGVDGGTISLTPPRPFKPGELVQVSATTGTLNRSGQGPVSPSVWQFWAGVTRGGGVFVDGQDLSGNDSTQDLALGDLDGDGDLDVFVANGNDATGVSAAHCVFPNTVWLNDGGIQGGTPGIFTDSGQSLGTASSKAVALGDLDGDGDLDAFVGNYDQGDEVWQNLGAGNFAVVAPSVGSAKTSAVALGDLDGDGDLDVLIGNDGQDDEVWFNDGTGRFTDSGQTIGSFYSSDVALGDLDGDGDLDAFVSTCCNITDTVWRNEGSGFFRIGQTLPKSDGRAVALGDVDNDRDLDVLVGDLAGVSKVWLNEGNGTFTDSLQGLGVSLTTDAALGDMDGDGDLDAFIGNATNQSNTIWLNDGAGIFTATQGLGNSNSQAVVLGDIDGDGDLDALDGNDDQPNEVWLNVTPEVLIDQITPNPSFFGEWVEFNGFGATVAVTETLEEYEWTRLPITETCGTQPDGTQAEPFGRAARLLINSTPVGKHRICLRARNGNNVWSDYATRTMQVREDPLAQSDIAVSRGGISFWKDVTATIPMPNPDINDMVYIEVQVDNISLHSATDTVRVSVYDGDVLSGTLVARDTIGPIAAGTAESAVVSWTVGTDINGVPISDYDDGYKVLTVDIDYTENIPYFANNPLPPWNEPHIESSYENNQATAFIVVGPPIEGTYAISVTAGIAPIDDEPKLYAGYAAYVFGEAHYNWGSQIPVMGAETTIDISSTGTYSDVYDTWTTAPFGRYVYPIQLPPTAGTYTATITVFDNNLFGATAMTFTVEPPPESLPDLYIERFSVRLSGSGVYQRDWHTYTPNRVYYRSGLFGVLNEPIIISAKVVNGGNLSAGPFSVSFYNGNPGGGGKLLGTAPVSGLISKTRTTVTFAWTPIQTGLHAIQVVVDEADAVAESNEVNNYDAYYYKYQYYYNRRVHRDIIDIRTRNPDLRATDLLYVEPNEGDTVTMTATVKNIGHDNIGSGNGFNVTILDGYPGISNTIILTETRIDGPMNQNYSQTINNIIWDTREPGIDPGQHHICVVVDTGQEIDEELEENNVNCWDPYVFPNDDDLYPVKLTYSNDAPQPNALITITATIRNMGAITFTGGATITFYEGAASDGNVIGTSILEGPITGRRGAGTTSITWATPVTHGTTYIYVEYVKDSGYNPGRRVYVRGLTIHRDPPPDLRVQSKNIHVSPQPPEYGDLVSVEADVANVGVTTATNFVVRFHTDSPSQGLVQLGSPRIVNSLAPGMTKTVQADATFVATDPHYAIKVEAMPPVQQGDKNCGDNEATTSITVSLLADLSISKDISEQRLLPNYVLLDYILTIANAGAVSATGPFTVTDTMPSGLNLENGEVRAWSSDGSWTCPEPQNLTVTCTRPGSLGPGASTQLRILGLSADGVTLTNTITNCATVDTPNGDNPANNTDCHVIALGEINGTVTSPDGLPLADIDITAYRPNGSGWDYAGWATTDAEGHYTLAYMGMDAYKIEFRDWSNRYYSEYYSDARDFESAIPIHVAAYTTTVIDADLDPISTGTITGTIVTMGSGGVEGVHVVAYPGDMDQQDYGRSGWGWSNQWLRWAKSHRGIGTTATRATGAFTLTLPTGPYRLYFFDPSGDWQSLYYTNAHSLTQATVVEVTKDFVVGITGTLSVQEPPVAEVYAGQYAVTNIGDGKSGVEIPSTEQDNSTLAITAMLEPCPSGILTAKLALMDPDDSSTLAGPYPMSPTGAPNEFTGSIPGADLVDGGEVNIQRYCGGVLDGDPVPVAVIVVYTPTGRITDAETGDPLPDVTVTLYKVPGWLPDASWSSLVDPIEHGLGVPGNPDLKEFDPPVNPQKTDERGIYSWDMAEGCWYVIAEAEWYRTKASPVICVPPQVTDLDLALTPRRIYLPLVLKGSPN